MTVSLNQIPAERSFKLDPRTYDQALACVHCGLCLPACPTYIETFNESDGPRGRIQLMRALSDGLIDATPAVRGHLDLCLDCRACETACPSGVVYHELIEETRARLLPVEKPTIASRAQRWFFFHVFAHARRLRVAMLPARILRRLGVIDELHSSGLLGQLPVSLQQMIRLIPEGGALWARSLPEETRPLKRSGLSVRVGLLAGCVGSVMFDEVNRKAVELLSLGGATAVMPASQMCCGAIHHHNGDAHTAENFARRNIAAFLPTDGPGVDTIASTIAGCGAMLRDYGVLLRDDPNYAARAKEFASRVRDITEVLAGLEFPKPPGGLNETVTYHDACHLAHAQKVTAAPRALLSKIPGLKMIPLAESDMCCGAAGTYNLTQPEMAQQLARRKLKHIAETGAAVCASGNVGCTMHLRAQANADGIKIQFRHPVELLHAAMFAPPE